MVILFILAMLQLRAVKYYPVIDIVILMTGFLCLVSAVVTFIASRRIKIKLDEVGTRYVEGESLNLSVNVESFRFCPDIKISIMRWVSQTGKKRKIRLRTKDLGDDHKLLIEALTPGTYTLDIDRAVFIGYFHVLRIFRRIKNNTKFTVYPKPEEFDYDKMPKFRQNGDGITTMRRGDDYSEIYEIRDFMDGDDIKYLHHALSAKYGKNMVKVGSKSERIIYLYYIPDGISFEETVPHLRKIMYLCQNKKVRENNSFCFVQYRGVCKIIINDRQLYSFIDQVYADHER